MPASQQPKVVIVGAGSLFFGRKAIWQMVHSPELQNGTLGLVDIDETRLNKMADLARKVAAHNKVSLKIEASTDRKQVLADADFVVLSFAKDNAYWRGVDCEVSAKYGIRMCSGDTIGPGGIMRACRELPAIFDCCEDIAKLCPDAWVINYINPAAVNGIAVSRFYPQLKSFALCDAQYKLRDRYAELAGVENDEHWQLRSAGPNHFTWLLQADYDGKDMTDKIVAGIRASAEGDANTQEQGSTKHAKGWLNNSIAVELYEAFGVMPTVLGHTKEYVRYYQGRSMLGLDKHPALKLFEVPDRLKWTQSVWERVDDYLSGKVAISEFDTEFGPDPATDLIEGMWANDGKGDGQQYFINQMNHGTIGNMADDAFVELLSDVSMAGPKPLACPDLPRGVRALSEQILDTHELTAEAIYKADRALLRRAFLTDPLTNSIGDTDALLEEMLDRQREALHGRWE